MQAAEVMLWEFDVRTRLFYAENEPLNGYDPTQALTIEDYKKQIHPEDWKKSGDYPIGYAQWLRLSV